MSASRVLVPVADGSEEMEATILVDVLRRAEVEVVVASPGGRPVTCSRGVRLIPDADLWTQSADGFDAIAIPGGGPGTEALLADDHTLALVRTFAAEGKWTAAICAAPQVLQAAGVLEGKRFTCHPGVAGAMRGERSDEPVVEDGRVLTSQGPGTGFAFALALVAKLADQDLADSLVPPMCLPAG